MVGQLVFISLNRAKSLGMSLTVQLMFGFFEKRNHNESLCSASKHPWRWCTASSRWAWSTPSSRVLTAVKVHRHTHEGGELQAQHEAVVHHLGCYQHSDFLWILLSKNLNISCVAGQLTIQPWCSQCKYWQSFGIKLIKIVLQVSFFLGWTSGTGHGDVQRWRNWKVLQPATGWSISPSRSSG